jgi:Pentapeptide repeats (8 copies)
MVPECSRDSQVKTGYVSILTSLFDRLRGLLYTRSHDSHSRVARCERCEKSCIAWGAHTERWAVIPFGSVSGQDLAGGDFSYADLRGVQLAGCQLRGANFRGAILCGANLRGVDARDTVFDLADLTAADCTEALLQGARLRQACLHYASLRHAFLLSAHLEQASLQETDFTGANCEWAWVNGLNFQEAIVSCTLFLNARGLSTLAQHTIEVRGGFTGRRPMILGRELYEGPLPGPTASSV